MRRWPIPSLPILGLCILAAIILALGMSPSQSTNAPTAAPELPALPASDWLNSKPLTLAGLADARSTCVTSIASQRYEAIASARDATA
jgi:hypothetical protein